MSPNPPKARSLKNPSKRGARPPFPPIAGDATATSAATVPGVEANAASAAVPGARTSTSSAAAGIAAATTTTINGFKPSSGAGTDHAPAASGGKVYTLNPTSQVKYSRETHG